MSKAFVNEDLAGDDQPDLLEARLSDEPRYVTLAGFNALTAERDLRAANPAGHEHRLRWLNLLLQRLTVVHPDPTPPTHVRFGCVVTVEEDSGETRSFQIVGPDERGGISIASPIARALLGKEEGEEVTVRLPSGTRVYEIRAIRNP